MIYFGPTPRRKAEAMSDTKSKTPTGTIEVGVIDVLAFGMYAIYRPTLEVGNTLAGLQKHVDGKVDCIDLTLPTGEEATMWFNDDGKSLDLPMNHMAMALASFGGWRGREFGDWIAGSVVLTGLDREEGETIALPDAWRALLTVIG